MSSSSREPTTVFDVGARMGIVDKHGGYIKQRLDYAKIIVTPEGLKDLKKSLWNQLNAKLIALVAKKLSFEKEKA